MSPRRLASLFSILVLVVGARADVALAPLFTDHAVLQRGKPVPIWGRADAGEKVTVTFRGQSREATTGADGRWTVTLDALSASGDGAELTVTARNTVTLHDLVVGEVWLCSGQSNMEWVVERSANAAAEIAAGRRPLVRHIKITNTNAPAPADTVATRSGWEPATPESVGRFSAVGYFFARDIEESLHVPVGIINSSWGGSPVEPWMPAADYAAGPDFAKVDARWRKIRADYPAKKAARDAALVKWEAGEAAAKAAGDAQHKEFLAKNRRPGLTPDWYPSSLFNGMIAPLVPYALRGALWYQGEANASNASEYRALFSGMIAGWRAQFRQGKFPFYWVSLANWKDPGDKTGLNWAFLREAQTQTLAVPHTGQALAIDIGNPDNIHPTNKQEVGRRLALLAKANDYGLPAGETNGPTFAGATREGAALRVHFAHAAGLAARDGSVQSLEIAGADRVFHPATATIAGETLLVTSPEVSTPVAVRYAWSNCPVANLHNAAGLPAVPFRSDDW